MISVSTYMYSNSNGELKNLIGAYSFYFSKHGGVSLVAWERLLRTCVHMDLPPLLGACDTECESKSCLHGLKDRVGILQSQVMAEPSGTTSTVTCTCPGMYKYMPVAQS